MNPRFSGLAAFLLALSLAACGGGGGGSGGSSTGSTNNSAGSWLTFSPLTLSAVQYPGESATVSLTATSSRTFSASFNVAVIDSAGVISPEVEISGLSPLVYRATLHTAKTLSAGAHSTMLEVRLCEDSPLTCAKPLPGSPWHVSLAVQVKSPDDAKARVTLITPSASVTTYPEESAGFTLEAQLSGDLKSRLFNIGVYDPSGIAVAAPNPVTDASNGHYVFNLSTTSNALSVGKHTSNLELRLCEDSVSICSRPIAGSPWIVPLSVTVLPSSNLTPLNAIQGLGAWSTYQGNAAHTGYVAATFDPNVFSRRWKVAIQGSYRQTYPSIAIDNGRVFLVRRTASSETELVAVSEETGEEAWKANLGLLNEVNPPAAANGRVYLTSTGHSDSYFWVYDQSTGMKLRQETISSQWPSYSAPTVLGNDVYTLDGYYGGVSKYGDAEGQFIWRRPGTPNAGWSPSTDGNFLYSYSTPDNILSVRNLADGSLAYSIGEPYPYSTYFVSDAVVLTDTQQAIVGDGHLTAFDLKSRNRSWELNTITTGIPAYGNGTIYAFGASGKSLEARYPSTGNLLWTVSLQEGAPYTNVIVTKNLAFVSSASSTRAIDLGTHGVVWTYPAGGSLAISSRGVLFVRNSSGTLAAVNLR